MYVSIFFPFSVFFSLGQRPAENPTPCRSTETFTLASAFSEETTTAIPTARRERCNHLRPEMRNFKAQPHGTVKPVLGVPNPTRKRKLNIPTTRNKERRSHFTWATLRNLEKDHNIPTARNKGFRETPLIESRWNAKVCNSHATVRAAHEQRVPRNPNYRTLWERQRQN